MLQLIQTQCINKRNTNFSLLSLTANAFIIYLLECTASTVTVDCML